MVAIYLALILGLGFFLYAKLVIKRVNAFRATANTGDYCVFFIDEERCIGKIYNIQRSPEGTQVIIRSTEQNEYIRDISEIYPV